MVVPRHRRVWHTRPVAPSRCLGGKNTSARCPCSGGEGDQAPRGAAHPPSIPCAPNRPTTLRSQLAKLGFARTEHGRGRKSVIPWEAPSRQRSHNQGHPGCSRAACPAPCAPHKPLCTPKKHPVFRALARKPALGSLLPCLSTTVISVHTKTPTPAHANQTSKTQTYEGIELISSEPGKKKEARCHYLYLSAWEVLESTGPCCASK